MKEDNMVIVLDLSNYKASFAEEVPFRAVVIDKYENEVNVRSLETSQEYELYYYQILEFLDLKEIRELLRKY